MVSCFFTRFGAYLLVDNFGASFLNYIAMIICTATTRIERCLSSPVSFMLRCLETYVRDIIIAVASLKVVVAFFKVFKVFGMSTESKLTFLLAYFTLLTGA